MSTLHEPPDAALSESEPLSPEPAPYQPPPPHPAPPHPEDEPEPAEPRGHPEPPPGGEHTVEYRLEDEELEPLEPEPGRRPGEDEDVLEETPDFLQDTPEHDRLWFEQRPPRDFDFDD